jgi:hypothetical protein
MRDLEKTQHRSEKYAELFKGLKIPQEAIDPFAGDGILKNICPELEMYDLSPKAEGIEKRDTLLDPPNYRSKWIISNPPYLFKSRTREFSEIFDKYQTDDLYKASLLSILDSNGGCLITPFNFFVDSCSEDVRRKFMGTFKIKRVNVFNKPMFESTTYSVCAFEFERGECQDSIFVVDGKEYNFNLIKQFGYRLGGEWHEKFKNITPIFNRSKGFETKLFLNALDTRKQEIRIELKDEYEGKKTDRVFARIFCDKEISIDEQIFIMEEFNEYLNASRKEYANLILSNYRDFGRKRISFDLVYRILTKIYNAKGA